MKTSKNILSKTLSILSMCSATLAIIAILILKDNILWGISCIFSFMFFGIGVMIDKKMG